MDNHLKLTFFLCLGAFLFVCGCCCFWRGSMLLCTISKEDWIVLIIFFSYHHSFFFLTILTPMIIFVLFFKEYIFAIAFRLPVWCCTVHENQASVFVIEDLSSNRQMWTERLTELPQMDQETVTETGSCQSWLCLQNPLPLYLLKDKPNGQFHNFISSSAMLVVVYIFVTFL